jgi:alkyl hydroperoxide reductase subunit F
MKVRDLIVIGAGPAGITASVYAARKRMDFLVITKNIGGQAAISADIENYTGYKFITGPELVEKFKEHMEQFNVEIKEDEAVTLVEKRGDVVEIETDQNRYRARTAIIASGRISRELGAEGEEEFKHRGVTYCATCDAPLFADVDVAVIGGGNSGLDAALQAVRIASKVYLIEIDSELRADPIMVEQAQKSGKVSIHTSTKVEKIYGETFVEGITVSKAGKTEDIPVKGVFVEIGYVPVSDFVKGVKTNEMGEIMVNCRCETNVPGIFAAGDVTDVYGKQIIVACGEGVKATLAAFDYLSRSER